MELEDQEEELYQIFICIEYLEFIKSVEKEVLIYYKDELITPRIADKIFNSFRINGPDQEFLNVFSKYALEDEDFLEYLDERENTCEECGHSPIHKSKLSRHHPSWIEAQSQVEKEFGPIENEEFARVELWKCPACRYENIVCCGLDLDPEEGLKK